MWLQGNTEGTFKKTCKLKTWRKDLQCMENETLRFLVLSQNDVAKHPFTPGVVKHYWGDCGMELGFWVTEWNQLTIKKKLLVRFQRFVSFI